MLKLVISDDEGKTTSVPLVREEITIGRKEGNTIRLTDRNVSRRHARLQKQNGHYLLHDLGSYNGIVLNGTRVHDVTSIKHGDQILIGDYKLAIQEEGAAPVASPQAAAPAAGDRGSFADTIEAPAAHHLPPPTPTAPGIPSAMAAAAAPVTPARTSMPGQPPAPRQSLPPPAAPVMPGVGASDVPGHIRQMRLVFLAPAGAPAPVTLERLPLILGRSEAADVALPFSSISREHARLLFQDGQLIIEDMGSSNGITINGNKLPRSKLNPGDLVALGVVEFRLATGGDSTAVLQRDAFEEVLEKGAKKKGGLPMGAVIGIVAAVLAVGGGIAVAMRGGSNPTAQTAAANPTAANSAPAANTPAPAANPAPPPAPAPVANAAAPAANPAAAAPEQPTLPAHDTAPAAPANDSNMVIAPGEDQAAANTQRDQQRQREREQQRERDRQRAQQNQENSGSSGSSSAHSNTASSSQTAAPAAPAVSPIQQARDCHGDNNCVVRALEGHARTEAEVGMLAVTYRLMGRGGDATRMMNQYIHRYPDGPRSAEFRRRLGIDQ